MPNTPVQRSYPQTLGDLMDSFLSEQGIPSLKVGGPVLSLFEAIAQGQFRNSGDIFTLLAAAALDQATGQALDNIGEGEGVPRQTEGPATGPVSIGDGSFNKVATTVYQGLPAPIVGSVTVNIADGSAFPSSGKVYIGRGTTNYEGPIPYSSIVNNGTYYTLQLTTGTQRFHNVNETVILAQGGNRTVSAGTLVQTLPTNVLAAVQFKLLYTATLPDGETSIDGVTVVATKPGTVGNVAAKAIKTFVSPPYTGATVINTPPFSTGIDTEDDDTYRERIRAARQSRSLGTPLAIKTNTIGTISPDDNKRVQSASLVTGQNKPTTLYIDDGTGYEEVAQGVAIESLVDQALGGEQDFKLSSQPPVTKAQLVSTLSAPFALFEGAALKFTVGGIGSEHQFDASQFRSIDNATAYEIVSSINGDASLLWSAHTLDAGTRVVVFAKADTNESIQNVAASTGDCNLVMGFTSTRVDTLRLYKNDRLLNKDGSAAVISTSPPSAWGTMTSAQSLIIVVDGITMKFDGTMFDRISSTDFVSANTGYTTIGVNSPAAWAAVFNYRIPGITAAVNNGVVTITSNRGMSLGASVEVVRGCDLVDTAKMFTAGKSVGSNSDYSLNRNTGELQLALALSSGDTLSAGSLSTRAFLQSNTISPTSIASTGNLWFSVDGSAQLIPSGMGPGLTMNVAGSSTAWGYRVRITSATATQLFTNILAGDWAVCWDPELVTLGLSGAYRVATVDSGFTWFEVEKATNVTTGTGVTFTAGGVTFVRTGSPLQHVTLASSANLQTASSFTATLNGALSGATASVYKTNSLRVATNTFALGAGDISLVAADVNGKLLPVATSSAVPNLTGHMASVESAGSELGTPSFHMGRVNTLTDSSHVSVLFSYDSKEPLPSSGHGIVGLRAVDDGTTDTTTRYSSNKGFHSPLTAAAPTGTTTISGVAENIVPVTMKKAVETSWLLQDRVYFAHPFELAPADSLTVLVDGDAASKRFTIPMARTLKPVGTTYGSTNTYIDVDNGNQSLAIGFGLGYDFNDCAVFMAARGKTDSADSTKSILWRYSRLGPDGNKARIQYQNPTAPSASLSFSVNNTTDGNTSIGVVLSSGAARTGYTFRTTSKLGYTVTTPVNGMSTVTFLTGFDISSVSRAGGTNDVTLTLTLPSGVLDCGLTTGNVIYVNSTDGRFPSGTYTIITSASFNQISYNDGQTSGAMSGGAIGSVSVDSAGEANFSGASITTGDFFRLSQAVPGGTTVLPTMATTVVSTRYVQGVVPWSASAVTAATWGLIDPAKLQFFQNPASTAAALVTAFNALANAPVKATLLGIGNGVIDRSSDETAAAFGTYSQLTDGVNYVSVTTAPGTTAGNYQLTFKDAITAGLATSSDWANEVVKVIPRTAKNIADWLSASTISGLFTAAEITASSAGTKLQLASLTPGSAGTIQVQGGSANNLTAPIVGTAAACSTDTTYMTAQVSAANAAGLVSGAFVRIDNVLSQPKSSCINASTTLTSFTQTDSTTVTVVLDAGGTPIWTATATGGSSVALLIEKQGNFMALSATGLASALSLAGAAEGDFVRIKTPASQTLSNSRQVFPVNTGMFRVVRIVTPGLDGNGGTVWIENPTGVEQGVAEADVTFYTADSLMVGDVLSISAPLWGTGNAGLWTVTSVGDAGSGQYGNRFTFKLDATNKTVQAIGSVGPLGSTAAPLVQPLGAPGRWFKRVHSIAPNQQNTALVDLKFASSVGAGKITAAAGSTLTALDKLGFPLTIAAGIDGYQHSIGLIGEVNRVIYGDPSDPATYPGVVAAAANVNIAGALIKRIQVSILLRVRSGAPTKDIADQVRSAVAAVINKKGNGESIALSSLTDAAGSVQGVVAATMIKPLAATGSDIIAIQPYEKPLVLSPDLDILVSFVGN